VADRSVHLRAATRMPCIEVAQAVALAPKAKASVNIGSVATPRSPVTATRSGLRDLPEADP